jgi:hypothetical protein
MGWTGIKNGDLVRLAEEQFDVFVTSDQNLRYQQNLEGRRIAIVAAPSSGSVGALVVGFIASLMP